MNWLSKALTSTIGKKVLMAITGLLLCGFLVVHLGGNLLLYVGAKEYNAYAHKLHEQKALLAVAEVGLFLLFAVHLWLAVWTTKENVDARPVGYAVRQSKLDSTGPLAAPAHAVMYVTGIIVLLFLVLHLADFRFELRNTVSGHEESYTKALRLLKDPLTCGTYIVGSLVLGYHVSHGFQSAFQTLGWRHSKYTPFVKWLGCVLSWVVAIGFASFPIWALVQK